jgi:hypothetical protein
MDTLAAFLDETCVLGAAHRVLAERLYQRYAMWCDKSGEHKDPKKAFVARLEERGFSRRRETAGVNKGRYIWVGIGLRSDDEPPDDAPDGSPSEPKTAEGSPGKSRVDIPNASGASGTGEPSEEKIHNLTYETPRVDRVVDSGFTGFTGFTSEQARRVRELVRKGFSEDSARKEVLAKDHPVGCECEVCL